MLKVQKPEFRAGLKSFDKNIYKETYQAPPILLGKENEDLFKIAFRNYLNLVSIADKKAHILIQVNCILVSVIIGFAIPKFENSPSYLIPSAFILIVAGLTILYSILASQPLKKIKTTNYLDKEPFFFGSYDRLDPNFKDVTWDKYSKDMHQLFSGDKKMLFDELIKESFHVRKVLARKFGYISIAYKIFIIGLLISTITFLGIISYQY
jgi:hypothetical protein